MRFPSLLLPLGAALLLLIGPPLITTGSGAESGTHIPGLRLMVPNTPGGGYDITARTAAKDAEDAGLNHNIEVFNLPGAGGTVGLSRLVNERGNGKLTMSMGLGVVGAVHTNKSPSTLADATPVARLVEEPDIVVVSKKSKYRTFGQLLADWKKKPRALPVGGGSSAGGPDHIAPMMMADKAGIPGKSVNYVPFDGGGELLASVLGGKVAFGVSGIGEYRDQIKSGELRLLAVTGPKRIPGYDAPTLKEAGVDMHFTNWRGVMAPPGLSEEKRTRLIRFFDALHASPQWRKSMKDNGWDDAYLSGDAYGRFLEQQDRRVDDVLKGLGQ
ncbi:tripartite tricarboxylate transporter substrate binding protein [Streptomyces sp. ODS28]|uniref:Bug family tripartite tricarboxylate transporter substrate binding protein n=1 Tax=Streptomyces sp. ODS28 TaxID=3136688 RepID=UPI0031F03ED7